MRALWSLRTSCTPARTRPVSRKGGNGLGWGPGSGVAPVAAGSLVWVTCPLRVPGCMLSRGSRPRLARRTRWDERAATRQSQPYHTRRWRPGRRPRSVSARRRLEWDRGARPAAGNHSSLTIRSFRRRQSSANSFARSGRDAARFFDSPMSSLHVVQPRDRQTTQHRRVGIAQVLRSSSRDSSHLCGSR